jgi:hypothetical protein
MTEKFVVSFLNKSFDNFKKNFVLKNKTFESAVKNTNFNIELIDARPKDFSGSVYIYLKITDGIIKIESPDSASDFLTQYWLKPSARMLGINPNKTNWFVIVNSGYPEIEKDCSDESIKIKNSFKIDEIKNLVVTIIKATTQIYDDHISNYFTVDFDINIDVNCRHARWKGIKRNEVYYEIRLIVDTPVGVPKNYKDNLVPMRVTKNLRNNLVPQLETYIENHMTNFKDATYAIDVDFNYPSYDDNLNESDDKIKDFFSKNANKIKKAFTDEIKESGEDIKQSYNNFIKLINSDKQISKEEKEKIGDELKTVLKKSLGKLGMVGVFLLPGGTVFILLYKLFKNRIKKSEELPFDEVNEDNKKIRIFSENTDSDEFKWHRDRENRLITVIESNNWELQIDNELPKKLVSGQQIIIPEGVYHRVIKGKGKLKVSIDFI